MPDSCDCVRPQAVGTANARAPVKAAIFILELNESLCIGILPYAHAPKQQSALFLPSKHQTKKILKHFRFLGQLQYV
jgi:hypothetical protein